ncbi:MAG: hypothetical protein LAO09_18425 [Acidobacteriia bacterium]|nr:hypothetical protein [Terriglobia bacterium]
MITAAQALSAVPSGLRDPLISEYQSIIQNFLEHRWLPSELSGGRFSEILYTILDGHAKKSYAAAPFKPGNFVEACRKLENNAQPHVPRSFKILIPRLLPALYEVRNNRSVGHVGGDVDPNHMDSVAVLSMCNWVMAELVRVFHGVTVAEAQRVVDALAEVRVPVVWSDGNIKRILRPELKLQEQMLLLIAVSVPDVSSKELIEWIEYDDPRYFIRTLRALHTKRSVEFNERTDRVKILPPGAKFVQDLVRKKNLSDIS